SRPTRVIMAARPLAHHHPAPHGTGSWRIRMIGNKLASLLGILALLGVLSPSAGDTPSATTGPIVFRGARICTAAGKPIANGILIVDRGKIVAVGRADAVKIPSGATVRDGPGNTTIPRFAATPPHLPIYP